MRQVVHGLAIALLFCFPTFSVEHPGDEADYCGDLMEFLALQTHHAKVIQWGRKPTRDLERRIAALKERLFTDDARYAGRLKEFDTSSQPRTAQSNPTWATDSRDGFEPYSEWKPEAGFGDWSPETEQQGPPTSPTEANYFPLENDLAQLEEYLTIHEGGDAEARVNGVFRRLAAERFFRAGTYKRELDNAGVVLPTQQQLTLELWLRNVARGEREGFAVNSKEFGRFAEAMNLPTNEALTAIGELDFTVRRADETARVRTLHEIMGSLASASGVHNEGTLLVELWRFRRAGHPCPTDTFGKLLQYYLWYNDELYQIRDAQSLHRFLVAHQE